MSAGTSGGIPSIRLLQLTTMVSTLDRFAMPPVLIAIAHDLGVPLSQIVQVAGAYFLAYGLMQPVWGMVSDWLGLVRTMRLTLLLAAVSTSSAAFVGTPLALGVTRGLAGGFFGAAYPASLIYIGDTVPVERRQRDITNLMVGVAIGTALASIGAGLVAQVFTWRAAFLATGLVAFALAFSLRHLVEPSRTRTHRNVVRPILDVVRSRAAKFVLLLAFTEGAVLLGVLTLLPPAVEAAGASAALAGTVIGAYGVAVYGFARLVGHLSRRLHPSWLIGVGAMAALVACVAVSFSRAPAIAMVVAVLLGLAWVALHSSLQTWSTEVVPGARATVVSLFAGSLFIGSAVAAVLVADLAEAGRYAQVFALAAMTAVPLGLLATWGRARWHRPSEGPG
jgi:MFS family permease